VTREEKILRWLEKVEPTTVVTGHYHLSVDRHVGRWHILNPGPVGAVMDGTHDACYLLLDAKGDHWQATFRRVPYDFARVEAAFQHHQLDEILGVEGMLKCEQLRRGRPTINAFSHWLDVHFPGEGWSFERAYEFLALPLEAVWDHIGKGYLVNPALPLPPAPVPRR
jgi:hypothetical protein